MILPLGAWGPNRLAGLREALGETATLHAVVANASTVIITFEPGASVWQFEAEQFPGDAILMPLMSDYSLAPEGWSSLASLLAEHRSAAWLALEPPGADPGALGSDVQPDDPRFGPHLARRLLRSVTGLRSLGALAIRLDALPEVQPLGPWDLRDEGLVLRLLMNQPGARLRLSQDNDSEVVSREDGRQDEPAAPGLTDATSGQLLDGLRAVRLSELVPECMAVGRRGGEALAVAMAVVGRWVSHRGLGQLAATLFHEADKVVVAEANARIVRGLAALATGQLGSAVRAFGTAVSGDPVAIFGLGECHRYARRYDHAVACYRRALEVAPEYADPHSAMREIQAAMGDVTRRYLE